MKDLVTIEDITSGFKDVIVRTRAGADVNLRITGVSARRLVNLSRADKDEGDLLVDVAAASIPPELGEPFLDTLNHRSLSRVCNIAMGLANGLSVDEKKEADPANPETPGSTSSGPS